MIRELLSPKALLGGVVAIAVIAIAIIIASPSNSGYMVIAQLADADNLKVHGNVDIDGVPAGEVTKLEVTRQNIVLATFKLDKLSAPIGSGASVSVRPTDLLGEHYADLSVGNLSQPQPSGTVIPLSRTSEAVELDDIFNMLDLNVRERLRILLNEAGVSLQGNGANFNQLLSVLPGNLSQTQALIGQIGDQTKTVENLIAEGDRVTAAINPKDDQLGAFVNQAASSLSVLAAKRAQIGATLQNAPAAFGQLTGTLNQLNSTAAQLAPAADALRSTAPTLTKALEVLPSFQAAARGTLGEITTVSPTLRSLGTGGTSPLNQLDPSLSLLSSTQSAAVPSLNELDSRAVDDVLWFVQNWYLASRDRDSLGHYVGVTYIAGAQQLTNELAAFLGTPTSPGFAARQALLAKEHAPAKLPVLSIKKPANAAASGPQAVKTVSQAVSGVAAQTVGGIANTAGGVVHKVTSTVQQAAHAIAAAASGTSGAGSASSSSGGATNIAKLFGYLFGSGS
jgi:phospholipid/cholesterol/gamma-HCH transport system substrate-binding protein